MCETCLKFVFTLPIKQNNVLKASRQWCALLTHECYLVHKKIRIQTKRYQYPFGSMGIMRVDMPLRSLQKWATYPGLLQTSEPTDYNTSFLTELYEITTLSSALCLTADRLKIHKENIEVRWSYATQRIFIRWRCVRSTYALTRPNPAASTAHS
jgi:hypothetical protein